jgi:hypothetical protein
MNKPFIIVTSFCVLVAEGEFESVLHPEESFDHQRTVVWSPLFQAGWDAMEEELGGDVMKVEPPNTLVERLSHFEWNAARVMPQSGWQIWTGPATEEAILRANGEAAEMLGTKAGPFKFAEYDARHRIYLGLLNRKVEFQKRFYRSRRVPMQFEAPAGTKREVFFFGVKRHLSDGYGNSVRVLGYRPSENCCALQMMTKGSDDTVVLFRPGRELSFAQACAWMRKWGDDFGARVTHEGAVDDWHLHDGDEVQVPYVALSLDSDLTGRLQGLQWMQERAQPRRVLHAVQRTNFRLLETGAEVRIEVEMSMDPFGAASPEPPPIIPRQFIYDGPFFVFLWRNGAEWPYFGCWVGDGGALEKFE